MPLSDKLLGTSLFWLAGIRTAWHYRGKRVTLVLGEKRLHQRVLLISVANTQLYGGIVRIAPDACVDDGLLNVVIFQGAGLGATAWHLVRVLFGAHGRDPQVAMYRVPAIYINGKNLPVHVDAEPIGSTPIEIRVRPRALRVLVPKTANRNLFTQPCSGRASGSP